MLIWKYSSSTRVCISADFVSLFSIYGQQQETFSNHARFSSSYRLPADEAIYGISQHFPTALQHKTDASQDPHTPQTEHSGLIYAVQCSRDCFELYIGEHRRDNSSGLDSAVHLHLKDKGHSFEVSNVHIFDRGDRWLGRGAKNNTTSTSAGWYIHCFMYILCTYFVHNYYFV